MEYTNRMREEQAAPATVETIAAELRALGVIEGMSLLVHSSYRSLGFVCGGPVAAVRALERSVGTGGTILVPAQTNTLTEPAHWTNPPVPATWFATIRSETPPFDPHLTPGLGMGIIAETLRRHPGAIRSAHPKVSFAALGARAHELVGDHPLAFGLGEASPLGRLFESDGSILLLGVGHDRNTSIHLAEVRAEWPGKLTLREGSPVMRGGERAWVEYDDLDYDSTDFLRIGASFEADTDFVRRGTVSMATARLMRIRPLVRYAEEWMRRMRPDSLRVSS